MFGNFRNFLPFTAWHFPYDILLLLLYRRGADVGPLPLCRLKNKTSGHFAAASAKPGLLKKAARGGDAAVALPGWPRRRLPRHLAPIVLNVIGADNVLSADPGQCDGSHSRLADLRHGYAGMFVFVLRCAARSLRRLRSRRVTRAGYHRFRGGKSSRWSNRQLRALRPNALRASFV